jgi:hypothetical protein
LRTLVEEGRNGIEIAAIFGRSVNLIYDRCQALGITLARRAAWTSEASELLVRLVAERKSGGQIGIIMSMTRSAIIGRCHRQGLQLLSRNVPKRGGGRRAKVYRALPYLSAAPTQAAVSRQRPPLPPLPVSGGAPELAPIGRIDRRLDANRARAFCTTGEPPRLPWENSSTVMKRFQEGYEAQTGRIGSILEVRPGTCKFPIVQKGGGPDRYCGLETNHPEQPWCEAHYARCTVPVRRRV